ncbi:large subunit of alpha-aminoadipate reductase [Chytridiales sp. JEL 0842]|nr:large subunit of alpha-aminoadipate reductase [Chytridiales sp. JEL 0842]
MSTLTLSDSPTSPTGKIPTLSPAELESRLQSCRARLANLTDLALPTDYPRPIPPHVVEADIVKSISEKTALSILQLSLSLAQQQLASGASADGGSTATPFDILLASFAVLLHKHTAEEDISVGSSSMSSNPLVLRLGVKDSDTFADVVSVVIKAQRDAAADEVPFLSLIESIFPSLKNADPDADRVSPTLFKVRFFNMTDTTPDTFSASTPTTSSACDLTFLISQSPTLRRILPIDIRVLYNTVLFSESRIIDMLDQLELVIETASKNPLAPVGSISLVTDASKARLPNPTADLKWDQFEGAITDIFARNAKAHPERVCVVESKALECELEALPPPPSECPLREFTYNQIHEASNLVAHALIKGGIQREDVVVLYSYRGVDLVVAVMGVLKAGATFSVIDPAYPPNRQIVYLSVAKPKGLVVLKKAGTLDGDVRKYIAEELEVVCEIPALELLDDGTLLGGGATKDGVNDTLDEVRHLSAQHPDVPLGPDSIGTLSFTSGSTGIPKGVRGRHFSLTHFYPWMKTEFNMSEKERFTMLSGIAHDPIQRDIFTPLFLGAQLRIPTSADIGTPGRLAEWMSYHQISVTHLTPAMGQLLSANASHQIPTLQNAFFVGDILTKRDVSRLQYLAPNTTIINMYGTTETQRAVSHLKIPPTKSHPGFLQVQKDIMPAGKGMQNVQLLVVNSHGNLCGVGEVGEIYVRSGGLAEGYLRLEEVTAVKFLSNPFNPSGPARTPKGDALPFYHGPRDRMYRTGDLGRYMPDGAVECTGRADDQVKIRGFRIELGEIDTHLSQHARVRENVTLVRRDKFEEPTLVCYFVPLDSDDWDGDVHALIKDIRDYLRQKLPAYAIPSVFAPLTRMPLTPNGKVDKNALPFPDTALAAPAQDASSANDLTPVQNTIRNVWASTLNLPASSIGLQDNFFDLGGHSILATRLVFEVRKELAVEVPLGAIYKDPTISGLAAEVERLQGADLNMGGAAADHAKDLENKKKLHMRSKSNEDLGGAEVEFDYAADLPVVDDPVNISINSPALANPGAPLVFPKAPKHIFLTGATGFLGAFLLSSLLRRFPGSTLWCLVRASDEEKGLARLRDNGERHLVWNEKEYVEGGRVKAVVGDLAKDQLGITDSQWKFLAENVDVVIHNGALVHWVYPYSKLRAPNVMGTKWALLLATTHKLKPFHLVSSTSVLDTPHYVHFLDAGMAVPESDDLQGAKRGLRSGYGQTKWVAENLVFKARSRGVPATIVRPGYIVGDSKTGVTNTDDFLWRLVKGCIQLGQVPRISNVVNMCPVDYVADATTEIASREESLKEGVFHMFNPHKFKFDDLFNLVAAQGYAVTSTEYIQWRTSLMDLTLKPTTSPDDQHALFPLLHFVLDDLPTSTRSPELDDSNTRRAIKPSSVRCADIRGLMKLYVGYLVAIGFVDKPATATDLPMLAEWDSLKGRQAVARTGN